MLKVHTKHLHCLFSIFGKYSNETKSDFNILRNVANKWLKLKRPIRLNTKFNSMDKRIIVIGAGASGIATTTRLIFAGLKNVVVLEAENRLGGRICTIPFGENILDMGAQWYVLCKETKIIFCLMVIYHNNIGAMVKRTMLSLD